MTCRVARVSQDRPRLNLVFCDECDWADLEVCSTLKARGAAAVPGLRPIHGRIRSMGGNRDPVVNAGGLCRMRRRQQYTGSFSGARALMRQTLQPEENAMRPVTNKKLDTIDFAGAAPAFGESLAWPRYTAALT